MPTDWHTGDKVLSCQATASKNLDPLINRSHIDLFLTPTTPASLLRDPPSQIVLLFQKEKKKRKEKRYNGQPSSDHLIRCVFPDKARERNR